MAEVDVVRILGVNVAAHPGTGSNQRALPTIVRLVPMNNATWTPLGADGTYHYSYSATALSVFWPETEHHQLLARRPHLAVEVGTTWDEHRQRIERHCALVARRPLGQPDTR